ncbi:sugar phosphate isomerase/epimerase family protein [Anaerosacchariphilus polymeriproducens]|uniref:Sugar phosphate isomerase/epimerase n=1 Tax=Anaerosacchariphilus polymeriproducens TaxID=1812858 RepID=A0A371AWU4_9FIRM|nr:sugar phosphate isomerase/epimerase family protein [Anaerosacchariphilus polymeriproducens]RDU24048.1 sugar phosphate isomerase/epimerase [Anaerosacchariphilus polymeriproducens]
MKLLNIDQIAAMNIHYLYYSFEYFLNTQERLGVKTIELWTGSPHFFLDSMTYSDCKRIRHLIEERGMQVKIITPENCIYQYQFASQEADIYEKSFQYFSNALKAGAELGCETMAVNSGWGYWHEDRKEALKRSANMLARLSDVAQQEGLNLAMESLRPQESQLVTTLTDAKKMYDEINHKNFKIMIDTTAMGVAGETIDQWFDVFGDEIVHMHFIDGNPYGHLIWGDGNHNLEAWLKTLAEKGYKGYLGQEITDFEYYNDPASHDVRNMMAYQKFFD